MNFSQKMSILGISCSIIIIAMYWAALNTALPTIQTEFSASISQLQWILNIFGISLASSIVLIGRLADNFGRKKIYTICLICAIIGFTGSGFSRNLLELTFYQAFIGLSAAGILPVSQAILSHIYPKNKRASALGLWAAIVGISLSLGPLYGGAILQFFSWSWLFFVNIPITVLALILVTVFMEETKNPDAQPIDLIGTVLLILTISSFIIAVLEGKNWSNKIIASLYIFSGLMLFILLLIEKKATAPILHPTLFKSKQFLLATTANSTVLFYVWGGFFLIPLYLENIHTYSVGIIGLTMLFVSLPLACCSIFIGKYYSRIGPKPLIISGFILLIISTCILITFTGETSYLVIAIALFLYGLGWGLTWSPTTTAAVSTLSLNEAGIASATFITFQEIGGNIGVAITGRIASMAPTLTTGFSHGAMVLLGVCTLGLIASLFIQNKITT